MLKSGVLFPQTLDSSLERVTAGAEFACDKSRSKHIYIWPYNLCLSIRLNQDCADLYLATARVLSRLISTAVSAEACRRCEAACQQLLQALPG